MEQQKQPYDYDKKRIKFSEFFGPEIAELLIQEKQKHHETEKEAFFREAIKKLRHSGIKRLYLQKENGEVKKVYYKNNKYSLQLRCSTVYLSNCAPPHELTSIDKFIYNATQRDSSKV